MDMNGEQRISAHRDVVWKALNDVDMLRACIPGCQELVKVSETEMTAIAVIKVGPISARFQGAVTLSDIDPPNGYRISGEGQGGAAGYAKGGATVQLTQDGDGTILVYDVSAQVGGKLAQLGGRMIDATARTLSAAFFKKFADEINRRYGAGADVVEVAPAAAIPGHAQAMATSSHNAGTRPQVPLPAHAQRPLLASLLPLLVLAAVLFAALWLWPLSVGQSPDMGSAVQLVIVALVGYLFGLQARGGASDRDLMLALIAARQNG